MSTLKQPKKDDNAVSTGEGCCGGLAPVGVAACCVKDAEAKAIGAEGCGCGTAPVQASTSPSACTSSPLPDEISVARPDRQAGTTGNNGLLLSGFRLHSARP